MILLFHAFFFPQLDVFDVQNLWVLNLSRIKKFWNYYKNYVKAENSDLDERIEIKLKYFFFYIKLLAGLTDTLIEFVIVWLCCKDVGVDDKNKQWMSFYHRLQIQLAIIDEDGCEQIMGYQLLVYFLNLLYW